MFYFRQKGKTINKDQKYIKQEVRNKHEANLATNEGKSKGCTSKAKG